MSEAINERKQGAILSYVTLIVKNLLLIIYTPIMLRLLGKSEYGIYQLVSSVVSNLGLLSLGFGSSYVRFYSICKVNGDEDDEHRLNGMFMLIFLAIGLICIVVGTILICNIKVIFADGLSDLELKTAKRLMILLVINMTISFPASVFNSIITAHEKYTFQKVIVLLQSIINPILTLPLLLLGYKAIAVVSITVILAILADAANMIFCFKKLNTRFKFSNLQLGLLKEMWMFSFIIFINLLADQINWSIDKFLLGRYSGSLSVAVYGVGSTIYSYYMSFATPISSVFIPKVNKIVAETDDNNILTELFTKVGRLQFMVLSYILIAFIFWGPSFIRLWAGKGYEYSYNIAVLLLVPITIPLIQNLGTEIQRAKNKHKFRSLVYLIMAIINIVLSIPLVKMYGERGAALGTAISLIVGNTIIMNWYYHMKLKINIIYFWNGIVKIIPALVAPTIVAFIFQRRFDFYIPLNFILCAIGYSIVFAISMWFIGLNSYEKNIIKKPFINLYVRK